MLKEKDKQIELAKEQLKKQCEIADERNDLLVKVTRLEKQIELMAEMIDELSEYYTRYWGKNNEFCKEDCIKKDIDCKDCIKQYFKNKVKGEEE